MSLFLVKKKASQPSLISFVPSPSTHGFIYLYTTPCPYSLLFSFNNASKTLDELVLLPLTIESSLMFSAMDPSILLIFSSFFTLSLSLKTEPTGLSSKLSVMGIVYCDICSNNSFSRHSYFIQGVEVKLDCEFKANSPTTTEQIFFSVNRTTDKFGIYRLEIPSVDNVKCAEGPLVVESLCKASLSKSSSSSCNVPGLKMTSNEMTIKSRKTNECIYVLSALYYRPNKRDVTLCGN